MPEKYQKLFLVPKAFRYSMEFILGPVTILQNLIRLVVEKYKAGKTGLSRSRSYKGQNSQNEGKFEKCEKLFEFNCDVHLQLLTWSLSIDSFVIFIHLFYLASASFASDVQGKTILYYIFNPLVPYLRLFHGFRVRRK